MAKERINLRVSNLTLHQLEELQARWNTSKTETITMIIDRAYQQETRSFHPMSNLPTTTGSRTDTINTRKEHTMDRNSKVTLKFVAQSGHVWEETLEADEIDSLIEQVVEVHGDIDHVEKLADPNDISGPTIWSFE